MPQHPFYNSKPWLDARGKYLRLHPWCAICAMLGKKVRASEVDHVKAIEKGGAPLNSANFRAMCKTHHSQKTFMLDSPRQGQEKKRYVVTGADGFPVYIEK